MSAKLLYSTDEKPAMQKQLGCMNGIFQLFDRHNFLVGRRVSGHSHKRIPPGQNANHGMESTGAADKSPVQEKILKGIGKEKQRVPVESSRTSVSSSCSSTFSSVDCHKVAAQPETSSFSQNIFPETPSPNLPTKQPNSSLNLGRQSLDLKDVVMDSMHRKASGFTVKTMANEKGMGHTMKHIDSPRPLLQPKSVQLRVNNNGSLPLGPKDSPRFSCDGRESRGTLKSTVKLKELPRLSLDSRESSIRSSASESRSNYLSRNIQRQNENSNQILIPNHEPGSNKRPSSAVARLMGLEDFPDSISTDEGLTMTIKSSQDEDIDIISRSLRIGDGSKQNQISRSPRVSHKDPSSPQLRKANSVTKPTSNSKIPLEPAPWRQSDGSRGSQKPVFKYGEAPAKTPHASPSVYAEIEKRLTELEFRKSGKDLRALKQILEAMQKTREMVENKKEEQPLNFESQTSKYSPNYNSIDQGSKLATQQSHQSRHPFSPTKGTSPPKRHGSPIVIIKPDKLNEKPRVSDFSVTPADGISGLHLRNNNLRDPSSRSLPSIDKKTKARTLRSSLSSKVSQHMGEDSTSFRRISGTVSPRLQQKKHGMEGQSRPTTPLSDLRRARRQSSQQTMEADSPTRKRKPKSTSLQQGDDDLSSGFSIETRNLSHHGDTVSVQSESNISLASQIDTEVTSIDRTSEINGTYQPKDPTDKVSPFPVQNFEARLSEDGSIAESATATLEQPSPVSVLDAAFYGEDSPSPVKKISNTFKDAETLNCDEAEFNEVDIDHLLNSMRPKLSSKFNHTKLENIKKLIHKLRLVNSTCDEATIDHIASLCESTSPDHRYITEILLASGFLKDLGSTTTTIQLHPAGHLINPNLYHVLEKTKGSTELANDECHENISRSKSNEKVRRKLVFDTVNEILVRKFSLAGPSELWIFQNKQGGRSPRGEKLLKELWSEMDHLQANPDCSLDDEMNQSEDWASHRGEVPGLVLDIERLIFKDLINEVVSGGAAGLKEPPGRHCRQLFSK